MGRDFGQVRPPLSGSRWSWDFDAMEPGDFFIVDNMDKPHGAVVNIVRVSAHRLGKRFSAIKHPNMVGFTLVTCKDWDEVAEGKPHVLTLDWHKFEKLLDEHGAAADDRMISAASYSWPVSWRQKPRMDEVRLDLWDGTYTVRFEKDRVVSEKHSAVAEPLPLPQLPKGDMFGTMFANEKPVAEEVRKLLDD